MSKRETQKFLCFLFTHKRSRQLYQKDTFMSSEDTLRDRLTCF